LTFYVFLFNGAWVQILAESRNFSLLQNVQTDSEAHPITHSMGIGVLPRGIKRPRREVDHSPPSSAEVKNEWSYTSTPTNFIFLFNGLATDFECERHKIPFNGGANCMCRLCSYQMSFAFRYV
jgi:hypothetical protein